MRTTVKRNCLWCYVTFHPEFREVKRGRGRYCSLMCANRAKASRMKKPGWREEWLRRQKNNPHYAVKRRARYEAGKAIKAGSIVKDNCEKCGSTRVEAHHDDYNQPLKVRWLCRSCHMKLHRSAD